MVRCLSEMTVTMKVDPFPTLDAVQYSTSSPHADEANRTITAAMMHLMTVLHADSGLASMRHKERFSKSE